MNSRDWRTVASALSYEGNRLFIEYLGEIFQEFLQRAVRGRYVRRSTPMNPYCLLDRLVDFEQRASRVYLTLSGRLDFSPHLQAFWKRLAEDEREHADIMGRSLTQLEVRECSPATSENALTILEAKVGAAEATVRQSGLGSDEAFRLTLMLEEAELNSLDEAWFQGFYSTRGSLLQVMLPEEESHIRHVVDAVRAFSTDERLQRQVAALWSTYERQRRRHSQAQTPNAGSDTSKGKDL